MLHKITQAGDVIVPHGKEAGIISFLNIHSSSITIKMEMKYQKQKIKILVTSAPCACNSYHHQYCASLRPKCPSRVALGIGVKPLVVKSFKVYTNG